MPSTQAATLASFAGESFATRDVDLIFSIGQNDVNAISTIDLAASPTISAVLALYPFAYWESLNFRITPGSGIFGRATTLSVGFDASDRAAPGSFAAINKLPFKRLHVYGGSGDPNMSDMAFPAPFSDGISDVLKATNLFIGGKLVLYYHLTSENFGPNQVNGPLFHISVSGTFRVHGRY